MKKYLPALLIAFLAFNLNAQITLETDDLPEVGTTLQTSNAVNFMEAEIGTDGPDQSWDFSNLTSVTISDVNYVEIAGTDGEAFFPNSESSRLGGFAEIIGLPLDAIVPGTPDPPTTAYFSKNNDGHLILDGAYANLDLGIIDLGEQALDFDGPMLFYTHLDFGESASSSSEVILPVQLDTIDLTLRLTIDRSINADGWGTVATPLGTYDCVRQLETTVVLAEVGTLIGPIFVPIPGILPEEPFIVDSYLYFAKEYEQPVVSVRTGMDTIIAVSYINDISQIPAPSASFEINQDCLDVDFVNSSDNADSYLWDFGDGVASTQQNPSYSYAEEGTYTVTLTVENLSGTDSFTQDITVEDCTIDIEESEWFAIELYPNPVNDILTINNLPADANSYTGAILNAQGKLIQYLNIQEEINLSSLPSGIYNLLIYSGEGAVYSDRIIKF